MRALFWGASRDSRSAPCRISNARPTAPSQSLVETDWPPNALQICPQGSLYANELIEWIRSEFEMGHDRDLLETRIVELNSFRFSDGRFPPKLHRPPDPWLAPVRLPGGSIFISGEGDGHS